MKEEENRNKSLSKAFVRGEWNQLEGTKSATRRQRNERAYAENNVEGGSVGCPQIISIKQ